MGQTGCGKTVFILDLLEGPYRGFFKHIGVLCPTVRRNKIYQQYLWNWTDPEVYLLFDPGERLHDYLRAVSHAFMGEPTLYIIDGCSVSTALTKKGHVVYDRFLGPLCRAICLGPHAEVQLCPEGLARADALGLFFFHCKDRDSFEDCLRENDVIPLTRTADVGAEAACRDEAC